MTLDEAIKHCEEVASENNQSKKEWIACKNRGNAGWSEFDIRNVDSSIERCEKCAEEHRQLAEWLTELKKRRENDGWIPVSNPLNELPKDRTLYITTKYGVVETLYWDMTEWSNVEIVKDAIAYMDYYEPEPYVVESGGKE